MERLGRSSLAEALKHVDLWGNRIEGMGAVALVGALAERRLRKLLLAGNPICPKGAEMVRKIFRWVDVGG